MTRGIAYGDPNKKLLRCLFKELRPMKLHLSSKNQKKTLVELAMIKMFITLFVRTLMFNLLLGLKEKLLMMEMVQIPNLMLKNLEKTLERRVLMKRSTDLLLPIIWFCQFLTPEEILPIFPMVLILALTPQASLVFVSPSLEKTLEKVVLIPKFMVLPPATTWFYQFPMLEEILPIFLMVLTPALILQALSTDLRGTLENQVYQKKYMDSFLVLM